MADPENEDWVRVKPRDGSSVVQIAAGSSSENRASFRLNAACWPTACLDELHQLDASLSTQHLDLCFHFLAEPEKLDENACIRFPENVHWYGLFDAESNVLPTYKTGNSLDVRRKSAFEDCANTYPPSGQRFAANQVHVRLDDSPSLGPARPPPALTIPSQWLRGRSDELFTFYSVVSLKQFKTVHATERSDLRLELGDLSKFVQGSRWTMAGGQVSCKVIEAQPRAGNTESAHGGQIVVGEFVDSRGKPLVCFRTKEKMSKGTLVRFQPSAKVCVVHVVKNKLVYAYDITSTFRRTCCGGTLSESAEIAADTPYGQWNVVIFGDIEFFERIQNAAQNQSNALEELRIALRTHVEEITEAGTSDNVSLGSITASDVLSVLDAQANLNSKLAVAIGTTDFGLRNMVQSRSLLSLQAGLPIVDCTEDSWQEDGSADGGVCETEAAAQQYFRDCDRHDLQAKLSLVRHFKGRGGRVVFFGSDCVSNRPHAVLSESTASKPTFHLHPSDVVYPVCHEGQNRSQVMHLVMQSVMGMLGAAPENVQAPHGATGGFDPHSAYVDLTDDNFYGYIHGPIDPLLEPGLAKRKSEEEDWSHIAFWKAFGLAKTARIGARMAGITLRPLVNRKPPPVTGLALNPDMQTPDFDHELKRVGINRRLMRDMFERTIYSSESCAIARLHRYLNDGLEPSGDNGSGGMDVATKSANPNVVGTTPSKARHRRVFITFCRAAAVTMQRLLDSCPPFPETDDDPAALLAAASSLRDVVIIALPWSDPVANAGCAEHINARNDELKQAGAPPTATRMSLTVEIYHHLYSQFAQLFPVVAENILRSKTASLGSRLQQRAIRLRQRRRSSGADCGSRLTDSIQMNKAFIDRELERVQLNTAALESISCGDHANDDDDVCCTVPMKNIHLAFPSIFTSERFHANLSTGHYVSWRQCVETSVYANFKDHIKVLAHQLVALVVTLHQRGIVLGALSLDSLLFAPKDPTRLVYYAPNSPLRTVLSFQVQQAMPEGPLYLLYSQIGMRYSVSPRRSGDQMATADSVSVPRWFLCPHVDILALGNVLRETFSDAQLSAPLRDLIARMTEPDISKRVNAHEIFETHLDAFQAWSLKSKKFALPRSMYSVRQAVAEINELVNELSFDENELRKAQRREEIATKNRGGVMSGSAMKAWVSKQLKIKTKVRHLSIVTCSSFATFSPTCGCCFTHRNQPQ